MWGKFYILGVATAMFFTIAQGQHLDDKRCRCICPSPSAITNKSMSTDRRLITASVPPNQCNCDGVILPQVGDEIKGHEKQFCMLCQCKFEGRNPTVIMVTVVMLLWVISSLVVYMAFLSCLDPFIRNKRLRHYRERGTEESRRLLLGPED